MAVWKLGPALAAGNSVVLKPSELTPLTILRFAALAYERQLLPPGVLNVLTGDGETVGASLVRHSAVEMVSQTGDVETGREVARNAADTSVRGDWTAKAAPMVTAALDPMAWASGCTGCLPG